MVLPWQWCTSRMVVVVEVDCIRQYTGSGGSGNGPQGNNGGDNGFAGKMPLLEFMAAGGGGGAGGARRLMEQLLLVVLVVMEHRYQQLFLEIQVTLHLRHIRWTQRVVVLALDPTATNGW